MYCLFCLCDLIQSYLSCSNIVVEPSSIINVISVTMDILDLNHWTFIQRTGVSLLYCLCDLIKSYISCSNIVVEPSSTISVIPVTMDILDLNHWTFIHRTGVSFIISTVIHVNKLEVQHPENEYTQ